MGSARASGGGFFDVEGQRVSRLSFRLSLVSRYGRYEGHHYVRQGAPIVPNVSRPHVRWELRA